MSEPKFPVTCFQVAMEMAPTSSDIHFFRSLTMVSSPGIGSLAQAAVIAHLEHAAALAKLTSLKAEIAGRLAPLAEAEQRKWEAQP